MPVVRSSAFASGTVTQALTPLNDSALPNLPAVVRVTLLSVPVRLLPLASNVVVPLASSNPYAATSPVRATAKLTGKSLGIRIAGRILAANKEAVAAAVDETGDDGRVRGAAGRREDTRHGAIRHPGSRAVAAVGGLVGRQAQRRPASCRPAACRRAGRSRARVGGVARATMLPPSNDRIFTCGPPKTEAAIPG